MLKEQCNMQQTLRLGQVAQPSVLAQVAAAVESRRQQVVAWCREHREQLECYVGGPLIMAFLAVMYYLASVLEGGAL